MNEIEQTIYNDGVNIKTEHYYTADDERIDEEYIQCDGLIFIFTFCEGELTNCRKLSRVF